MDLRLIIIILLNYGMELQISQRTGIHFLRLPWRQFTHLTFHCRLQTVTSQIIYLKETINMALLLHLVILLHLGIHLFIVLVNQIPLSVEGKLIKFTLHWYIASASVRWPDSDFYYHPDWILMFLETMFIYFGAWIISILPKLYMHGYKICSIENIVSPNMNARISL